MMRMISYDDVMKAVSAPQMMTTVAIGNHHLTWTAEQIPDSEMILIQDVSETIGFVGTLDNLRQTIIEMSFAVGNAANRIFDR